MPNDEVSSGSRVLVVGVSTRAFAESAARAGYDVTALDAFGDLDQHAGVRSYSLPRDFGVEFSAANMVAAANDIDCDAIAYLSPFENHPALVERLSRRAMLLGNDAAVLRRVRDPQALTAFVPSHASSDPERWLLKPRASGGGQGIRWWTPGEPVPRACYVQPFFEGTPGSIVFVAANGSITPLGLTRQLVGEDAFGATGFRYCGSILVSSHDAEADPEGRRTMAAVDLATEIARRFELRGVNCIDFIAQNGVPIPVEVNPRCSASMELVERAYGVSIFAAHALACSTGALPAFDLAHAREESTCSGKAIVFARHDVVCGDTRAWLSDSTVRDVPHPDERVPAGRPVCTVFANGTSAADCHAALVRRAREVYDVLDTWASVHA